MNEQAQQEAERVQVHIDEAKEAISMADKLEALTRTPEFQDIILKGFMEQEPARIAAIITDHNLLDDINQREILGALKAVGYLGDYLRNISRRGNQLRAKVTEFENLQTDILNPEKED